MSRAEYAREWAKNRTPEQIERKRQSNKAWIQKNIEAVTEKQKLWRDANKEKVSESGRRATRKVLYARYGLSMDDYESILAKQKGICAICGTPPGKRPLSVDHCHDTGAVRGLLCHACNTGIGFLKDNTDLLKKAIKYLNKKGR